MSAAQLTYRQRQHLQLRADGLRLWEIAEQTKLHRTTCDDHLYNARKKLGAKTTVQAVAIAIREGVVR